MFNCLHCNKEMFFRKNTANKYCTNKCQKDYEGNAKVQSWLDGKTQPTLSIVRRYLNESRGYNCEVCKISEWNGNKLVLEVDHIDGDSKNNHPSNFRFICPNCHSQTSTYKGANRGKGRPKETRVYTIQRSCS
jgi:hypothetical protein